MNTIHKAWIDSAPVGAASLLRRPHAQGGHGAPIAETQVGQVEDVAASPPYRRSGRSVPPITFINID